SSRIYKLRAMEFPGCQGSTRRNTEKTSISHQIREEKTRRKVSRKCPGSVPDIVPDKSGTREEKRRDRRTTYRWFFPAGQAGGRKPPGWETEIGAETARKECDFRRARRSDWFRSEHSERRQNSGREGDGTFRRGPAVFPGRHSRIRAAFPRTLLVGSRGRSATANSRRTREMDSPDSRQADSQTRRQRSSL